MMLVQPYSNKAIKAPPQATMKVFHATLPGDRAYTTALQIQLQTYNQPLNNRRILETTSIHLAISKTGQHQVS